MNSPYQKIRPEQIEGFPFGGSGGSAVTKSWIGDGVTSLFDLGNNLSVNADLLIVSVGSVILNPTQYAVTGQILSITSSIPGIGVPVYARLLGSYEIDGENLETIIENVIVNSNLESRARAFSIIFGT